MLEKRGSSRCPTVNLNGLIPQTFRYDKLFISCCKEHIFVCFVAQSSMPQLTCRICMDQLRTCLMLSHGLGRGTSCRLSFMRRLPSVPLCLAQPRQVPPRDHQLLGGEAGVGHGCCGGGAEWGWGGLPEGRWRKPFLMLVHISLPHTEFDYGPEGCLGSVHGFKIGNGWPHISPPVLSADLQK